MTHPTPVEIEEVVLRADYVTVNAAGIDHALDCRARTLSIAREAGRVTGIACTRCARPQRCSSPKTGGPHGADATRLTPAGWRCGSDADAEGWPVGPDGWSWIGA